MTSKGGLLFLTIYNLLVQPSWLKASKIFGWLGPPRTMPFILFWPMLATCKELVSSIRSMRVFSQRELNWAPLHSDDLLYWDQTKLLYTLASSTSMGLESFNSNSGVFCWGSLSELRTYISYLEKSFPMYAVKPLCSKMPLCQGLITQYTCWH